MDATEHHDASLCFPGSISSSDQLLSVVDCLQVGKMRHFNCQQNAFLSSQKYTKIDGGGLGLGCESTQRSPSHSRLIRLLNPG